MCVSKNHALLLELSIGSLRCAMSHSLQKNAHVPVELPSLSQPAWTLRSHVCSFMPYWHSGELGEEQNPYDIPLPSRMEITIKHSVLCTTAL
jgi:hypothetical protein